MDYGNMKAAGVPFPDVLLSRGLDLSGLISVDEAKAEAERRAAALMKQFDTPMGSVAPKGTAERALAVSAEQVDGQLQNALIEFADDWDRTEAYLRDTIAKSRQAPPKDDPARELVWYHRLEGRTLAELADLYIKDNEGLLTFLIESDDTDWPRTFRLSPTESLKDAAAIQKLQAAIAAKQEKRQDADAVKLLNVMREHRETQLHRNAAIRDARRHRSNPERFQIARLSRS